MILFSQPLSIPQRLTTGGEGSTSGGRFKHIKSCLFTLTPLITPTFSIFVRVGGAPTFPARVGVGTPTFELAQKSAQGLLDADH